LKVSVVIPTFNGAHRIGRLLRSLSEQAKVVDEIVVVVDGSTDDTRDVLAVWKQELPFLKIVEQANQGRAVVRNTGAAAASGELLVFFDDDVTLAPGCLDVHLAHHERFPGSLLTGPAQDCILDTDFRRYKASLGEKWTEPLLAWEDKPLLRELIFITAANFSVDRDVFIRLGGFNAQLKDAEDFELAVRAYQQSLPLFFNSKALVWHHDPITLRTYIKRLQQYRRAHFSLEAVNPDIYELMPERRPLTPAGLKKWVFRFFARPIWLSFAESGLFRTIVPTSLRYRIYNYITTSFSFGV
jgi:glycosyltransferase involved in cell wall biosynthesis